MELAHSGDNGLTSLLIGVGLERGILLGELLKADGHLLLTGLGLGLDSDPDNGVGELHGLKHDLSLIVAEGVAGGGVLKSDAGGDITGIDNRDVLAMIRVHLKQSSKPLALALSGVDHR